MWIPAYLVLSIKRPQNPPVFRWKGKRNSRVYIMRGGEEERLRGAANRLQTAGVPKAEKPTTTSFLGSTTRTPHPGPFFLPPQSHSHPLLAPRKYFSLTLFESYQWQAGRRARGGGGADGTVACCGCLRDLGERARARGHGCSLLQALRLLVASPLQIADARYAAYRTLPPPLPLPRILRVFVFSLLITLSPRPAPDSSVVGGGGVGPAFGVFFLLRLFRGFCCSFPRA